MDRRPVAGQGVWFVVQADGGDGGEEPHRPFEDFLGGAVVDSQSPAPSADAYADAAKRDAVVVDALVRVGHDEQVVRAGGDGGAEQPPLGRVKILAFVDNDVPIWRDGPLSQDASGLVSELEVGVLVALAQGIGHLANRLPRL